MYAAAEAVEVAVVQVGPLRAWILADVIDVQIEQNRARSAGACWRMPRPDALWERHAAGGVRLHPLKRSELCIDGP
jgi:hypothetical protein